MLIGQERHMIGKTPVHIMYTLVTILFPKKLANRMWFLALVIALEYRVIVAITSEIIWIQSLPFELHPSLVFIPFLFCDNLSAKCLAQNPILHDRIKHIEIDHFFIHD